MSVEKKTRKKKEVVRDQYIGARFTVYEKKLFDKRCKGLGKSKLIRDLLLGGSLK
jgi:hypothetical protein